VVTVLLPVELEVALTVVPVILDRPVILVPFILNVTSHEPAGVLNDTDSTVYEYHE